jgi:hypothetical protein
VNQDARISTSLPGHPKTVMLERRLGGEACWSLVCLFLWAARNKPSGDLTGMSVEYIEIAAGWKGETGSLYDALVAVGFIDEDDEGNAFLHDWADHNPWASGSDLRQAKAKWNAIKRHHGEREADRQVPAWAATRNATSNAAPPTSNAPSPSPSPSPSPKSKAKAAPKPVETAMPDDFGVSPRVTEWAKREGHTNLDMHLAAFRITCEAKGYRYVNWDSAFMKAIRDDWARINGARAGPPTPQGVAKVNRLEEMKRGLVAGGNPDGAPKALALALGEQPGDRGRT